MRTPSSRFVTVLPTLLLLTLASHAQFSQRGGRIISLAAKLMF
jgi:hypothetical protein